jgi:hypothetical protein
MLPVTCRHCGIESFTEFPAEVVKVALTQWNNLALHADCHAGTWDASESEMKRISDYLMSCTGDAVFADRCNRPDFALKVVLIGNRNFWMKGCASKLS